MLIDLQPLIGEALPVSTIIKSHANDTRLMLEIRYEVNAAVSHLKI